MVVRPDLQVVVSTSHAREPTPPASRAVHSLNDIDPTVVLQRRLSLTKRQLQQVQDYHATVKGCMYLGRSRLIERYTTRITAAETGLQQLCGVAPPSPRDEHRDSSAGRASEIDATGADLQLPWTLDTGQVVDHLLWLRKKVPRALHDYVALRVFCDRLTIAGILSRAHLLPEERIWVITTVPPRLLPDLTQEFSSFLSAGRQDRAILCAQTGRVPATSNLLLSAVKVTATAIVELLLAQGACPNRNSPLCVLLEQVPPAWAARRQSKWCRERSRRQTMPSSAGRDSLTPTPPPEDPLPSGAGLPLCAVPCYGTPLLWHGTASASGLPCLAFGPTYRGGDAYAVIRSECPLFRGAGSFQCHVEAAFALGSTPDAAVAGWCDTSFDVLSGVGLGFDPDGHSWGVSVSSAPGGLSVSKLHRGRRQGVSMLPAAHGSFLRLQCTLDINEGTMSFSVDEHPPLVCFVDFAFDTALFPAAAAHPGGWCGSRLRPPSGDAVRQSAAPPAPIRMFVDPCALDSLDCATAVPPAGKLELVVRALLATGKLDPNQTSPVTSANRHLWQMLPTLSADEEGSLALERRHSMASARSCATLTRMDTGRMNTRKSRLGRPVQPVQGPPPLHSALYQSLLPIARLLVGHGDLNVDAVDHLGNTALMLAGARSATDIVAVLLSRGARTDIANSSSLNAVHAAILGGSVSAVQLVLQRAEQLPNGVQLLSKQTAVAKDTAAVLAVRKGMPGVLRRLLSIGADCVQTNAAGHSPLLLACKKGDAAMAESITDALPEDVLGVAEVNVRERVHPYGTALLHAVAGNMASVCGKLLARGADPLMQLGDPELSALSLAVRCRCAEAAEVVLQGALTAGVTARQLDVAEPRHGYTALNFACAAGLTSVVVGLLRAGCDPNIATKSGVPPLLQALNNGNHATVAAFLAAVRANLAFDVRDRAGDTALGKAAAAGLSEVVEVLLEKGADVNGRNKAGYTPLALAIEHDNHDTALRLVRLTHGALDLAATVGPKQLCYLQMAFQAGCKRLVQLLLELRAPAPQAVLQAVTQAVEEDCFPPPRDRTVYQQTRGRGDRRVSTLSRARQSFHRPRFGSPLDFGTGVERSESHLTDLLDRRSSRSTVQSAWEPAEVWTLLHQTVGTDAELTFVVSVSAQRTQARLRQKRLKASRFHRSHKTRAADGARSLSASSSSSGTSLAERLGTGSILLEQPPRAPDAAEMQAIVGAAAVGVVAMAAAGVTAVSSKPRPGTEEWGAQLAEDWVALHGGSDSQGYAALQGLVRYPGEDDDMEAVFDEFCQRWLIDCTPLELMCCCWPLADARVEANFERLRKVVQDVARKLEASAKLAATLQRTATRRGLPALAADLVSKSPRAEPSMRKGVRSFRGFTADLMASPSRPDPDLEASALGEVPVGFVTGDGLSASLAHLVESIIRLHPASVSRALAELSPVEVARTRTANGMTLLHVAACSGCVEVIRPALVARLKPGTAWDDGITPLMLAILNGQDLFALSLLREARNAGADCAIGAATTLTQETALGLALRGGMEGVALALMPQQGARPPSGGAVKRAAVAAASDVSDAGEMLLRAVESGCEEVVGRMLELDWDRGTSKQHQQKILLACCDAKSFSSLQMLVARGFDPSACEWDTAEPLPVRILDALRTAKPDAQGFVARFFRDHFLHSAAPQLVQWRSQDGKTLLHCACAAQALRVAEPLLSVQVHGQHINASERDAAGKVAIDYLQAAPTHERSGAVLKLLRRTETRRVRRWLSAASDGLGPRALVALCGKLDPGLLGSDRDAARGRASDDVADMAERFWTAAAVQLWFRGVEERDLCWRYLERIPLHWYGQLRGPCALTVMALCTEPEPAAFPRSDSRTVTGGTRPCTGQLALQLSSSEADFHRQRSEYMSDAQMDGLSSPRSVETIGSVEQQLADRFAAAFRNHTSPEPLSELLELAARYGHEQVVRWGTRIGGSLPHEHPARARALISATAACRVGCMSALASSMRSVPLRQFARLVKEDEQCTLFDLAVMGRADSDTLVEGAVQMLLDARAPLGCSCLDWIQEREGSLDHRTSVLKDTLLHVACINGQQRIAELLLRSDAFSLANEANVLGLRPIDYTTRPSLWRLLRAWERRAGLALRVPVYLLPWHELRRQAGEGRRGEDRALAEAAALQLRAALEEQLVSVDTEEETDYAGHWALSLTAACLHKSAQAAKIRVDRTPVCQLLDESCRPDESILTDVDVHRYNSQQQQVALRHVLTLTESSALPVSCIPVALFWPYARPCHTVRRTQMQLHFGPQHPAQPKQQQRNAPLSSGLRGPSEDTPSQPALALPELPKGAVAGESEQGPQQRCAADRQKQGQRADSPIDSSTLMAVAF